MDICEREAIGIRGRFGVDVWEKWLSFQHSQEDFLRNYGVSEDRIDGTVLALKRLLRDEGIVAYKNSHRANRKRAYTDRPDGWLDGRWVPSNMPFDERDKFWGTSPDGESRDGYVWLEYNKDSHKSSRRANRKVASNPLFIRLLASRGVYGVGISGDIMAYVDLPIDENGTNFYWVVIDSNGDEIVGGPSSSFEEATSLAENNLFRLSRELYPDSYTSHRANRKRVRASVRWESSGMGYVSENYTVHNMGGEVYGEPDQWTILKNDYGVPEISGVFDTAEDAMNAVEQKISHRANRKFSMQMDYGRKSFLDEQEIRSLAWEIFNNDPQYSDYSESDFGQLGRIEPNWIRDAIDKNVKNYLLEHNIPFNMANVSQISNLIVNNRIVTYEKVDGGYLETIKSASHRANRKRAYYDDDFESGGAFNYESPNYEYYTDREIEEGLRPLEFGGWSNRETQLAIQESRDTDVLIDLEMITLEGGTPEDIASYYLNHIDHGGYDLNSVNWTEVWEAFSQ